ncbi:MAG: hypothetical protein KDB82_05565 [Planctomycetes bacterium]|nr:hypothetical protein [Planctomycetota bacterium]
MRHKMPRGTSRKGFTLVEAGVAVFIVTVVALAGFAYYASARVTEITEWHEQNALFMCEREIESWHSGGYTGLAGFTASDSGNNFLPYGYSYGSPDPDWNQAGRYKEVVLDGVTYRVRAHNYYNANTGNDYYVQTSWSGVTYYYRQIDVVVQWGSLSGYTSTFDMDQETRMAR